MYQSDYQIFHFYSFQFMTITKEQYEYYFNKWKTKYQLYERSFNNWIPTFANTSLSYNIFTYHIHHWWQFEKIWDQSKTKNWSSFRMSSIIIFCHIEYWIYRCISSSIHETNHKCFVIDMFGTWGNTKFLISSIRLKSKSI